MATVNPPQPFFDPLAVDNYPTTRTFAPASPPLAAPLDSYWTAHYSSSLSHRNSTGPLPSAADVVIIGSGLTGSTAAAELVDKLLEEPVKDAEGKTKTVKVVVIEARTFCSGATGRNGGHLTAYPVVHYAALAEKYGVEDAVRAVKLEDEAIDWLLGLVHDERWEEDVDLQEGGGTLAVFDSPLQLASVRESLAAAQEAGLSATVDKTRWFSAAEAKEKYGIEAEGALMVPGNNLYPLKFVTKLFQRALRRASSAAASAAKNGDAPPVELELYTHTVASGVEAAKEEGRWVVKTDRGEIETAHVLHATNAYLSSVLPSYTSSPTFPGVLPTRGQVLSLLPTSPTPSTPFAPWKNAFSPASLHPGKGVNTYAFQRQWSAAGERRGEIIIGGMREFAEDWEWGVTDDGSVSTQVGRGVRESFGKVWPGVFEVDGVTAEGGEGKERIEVREEWTGIMGYREEGNPIVGPVFVDGKKQPGQWVSAGYSGHGMPRAPLCGRLTASLIYHHLSLSSTPFNLPPHFPRHLLATPDGKGHGETRLEEEDVQGEKDGKKREKGWVWVKGTGKL
ncbi:hypothetical protein JCM8097_002383 [Rhodosporidiobolus ruineniae]